MLAHRLVLHPQDPSTAGARHGLMPVRSSSWQTPFTDVVPGSSRVHASHLRHEGTADLQVALPCLVGGGDGHQEKEVSRWTFTRVSCQGPRRISA